ncbi:MAG: NYN domain-containing protein [Acidobacteriota bacterium]|nr:NYN domain-containing protein [Acidobacteriota bacterium]
MKNAGIDPNRSDYRKIAAKLVGPRQWIGLRYYVGQVKQVGNLRLASEQQAFLSKLKAADPRISVHLGRIEERVAKSAAAVELLAYLADLRTRIDPAIFSELLALGERHKSSQVMVEKGVDVMLAVDLVVMAERNEFDVAYLLSADGDYTHAASVVRAHDKKMFAASASYGAQLAREVDSYIRLTTTWFSDCLA